MTTSQQMIGEAERLEVAGDWLLRLQAEPLSEQELAEWLRWYDADAGNRAAFEKVQAMFEAIHAVPAGDRVNWADQLRHRRDRPSAVGSNAAKMESSLRPRRLFAWLFDHRGAAAAFGAAVVLLIGIGMWQFNGRNADVQTAAFKTERATHRDVALPDGSNVRLGARSQLFSNFTPQARYLVLQGGEAFFKVAKDPDRPFLVQAGGVTVRALGTEFNVRLVMDQAIVTVTEGSVDVLQQSGAVSMAVPPSRIPAVSQSERQPVRLMAGEQATVGIVVAKIAISGAETKAAIGWQEGRLEFIDEPLRLVVGTINRYSQREVVITDRALNDLRFTGTVRRERIDEWLSALPDIFPVDVRRAGNETVLVSQRAD